PPAIACARFSSPAAATNSPSGRWPGRGRRRRKHRELGHFDVEAPPAASAKGRFRGTDHRDRAFAVVEQRLAGGTEREADENAATRGGFEGEAERGVAGVRPRDPHNDRAGFGSRFTAHDDEGTVTVPGHSQGSGSEQEPGEPTYPTGAEDDQIGFARLVDQL